ncbi:50S ribosomal protein L21 [Candidatus Saccharibacteria bacterium RIFCSPLOWO2_01_FULL_48_13]|nr:MAG: 50S ribosomal protein L21 [Candidatus Saccharibacteria bacterium RIFCSPHIGHO2_01_FULL_48_12]OGL35242.1 MAG: 50S ribosomal protein L21 [Candidatus Saccharibacteria bacterium RIFCSPHIGHO2_12_FULL_48_21]OGL37394.1 MAG: 50S ribosomal protein L21 [Candidatus Saccharibacteria bacterium RIFCSPLOWO2_01_FULL_48_13]
MAEKIAKTSKKAVLATGGKQYLVSVGDELEVELLEPAKNATFDALLVVDGDKTAIGQPLVEGVKVTADITEQVVKAEKVTAIRYKSKKRVRKTRGHRQKHTRIKITKIA